MSGGFLGLGKNPKPSPPVLHHVIASSFADPEDIAAFRRCKAHGNSDQVCFKVGDNGIGKWGDDTTGSEPMCALPPEEWRHLDHPNRAYVFVEGNGRRVICRLADTMPSYSHITNGCGIDLNPAAVSALGLRVPLRASVTWNWA